MNIIHVINIMFLGISLLFFAFNMAGIIAKLHDGDSASASFQALFSSIFLIMAVATFLIFYNCAAHFNTQKNIQEKIESGYTIYLDGDKKDKDTVDISQYSVSVNDEKKSIYLTPKSRTRTYTIPFFIPFKY